MKTTIVAAVGGALIAILAGSFFGHENAVYAQRPSVYDSTSGGLLAFTTQVDNGRQQIIVIDPVKRAICVYHVDLPTGGISLKSVRNISGDLQIDDFNGASPLPREVRSQLEPR